MNGALFVALYMLCALPALADDIPPDQRRSGFEMMGAETRAMQQNDLANPAMLAVREGNRLWNEVPEGARSCASCHGEAAASMKGVAARYPAFDVGTNQPVDLAGRILQCRSARQGQPAWPRESRPLVALTAFVALQSRGQAIAPPADERLSAARAAGKALYEQRIGQLNLSCQQCHSENWGKKLGGATIPQAHPTGYPLYRLEWQATGTLQRRIRNCMTGVRAEPLAPEAPEMIALELYLMQRASGMAMDAPAVRP